MHTFKQSVLARLHFITTSHHKRQVIYILSKQINIPLKDTFDADFKQSVFARLYFITISHHRRQVIYIL